MLNQDREHETYTEESPNYGISKKMLKVLSIAIGLLGINIMFMVYLANTKLADYTLLLFKYPIVGVIAFGLLLTVGREISLRYSEKENTIGSILGVSILQLAYGAFGGAILSRFSSTIWGQAITTTIVIVLAITAIATFYVNNTNRDLSFLGQIASGLFLVGIVLALVGTFISSVLVVAFIFFLLGFLVDLFYEIWLATSTNRNPISNGIAVYVAVTGLFVHILQIVLEYYANS